MPVDTVASVLDQCRQFCDEESYTFLPYPMHDVLTHPNADKLLVLFSAVSDDADGGFEPLPTNGVTLATREDWPEILDSAKRVGTRTLWFSFHGVEGIHDEAVHRPGSYKDACLAVQRTRLMGFRTGCNVFLTKRNVPQFDDLLNVLNALGIEEVFYEVAAFRPTERGRRYEAIRPELDDLSPLGAKIAELSIVHKEQWGGLDACTESAYFEKATGSDDVGDLFHPPPPSDFIRLVCRDNFDLHTGNPNGYSAFHGNIEREPVRDVLRRAVISGPLPEHSLLFSATDIPAVGALALRVAERQGQKIYFEPMDVYLHWLDRALCSSRRW